MVVDRPDAKKVEELTPGICIFVQIHKDGCQRNYVINAGLVVAGILLGVGVTAAGFFGQGAIAGVLVLFITLLISLQNAFFLNEKAEFQRLVFTEAENLLSLLHYRVRSEEQVNALLDSFMTLKGRAAEKLPKGKGMDVVREMYGSTPQGLSKPGLVP